MGYDIMLWLFPSFDHYKVLDLIFNKITFLVIH